MLRRLGAEGLVKHEKYQGTILTDKGRKIANAIITRHETPTKFLRLFEIDEDTIYADVEGMEHHVSKATLSVITTLVEELKTDSALLSRLREKI